MGYWTLKEEALDRTVYRTRFGRGCGYVGKADYEQNEHSTTTPTNSVGTSTSV